MKLLFKQRLFSWFDSYDIYDKSGRAVFTVEGKPSWGHKLHILNAQGGHIGTVKQVVLTFLPRFELYVGEQYVGSIHKEFTFFKPRFQVDCNGWQVEGDLWGWDYRIRDGYGRTVAAVSKELFNWTDTYSLDVADSRDALLVLMVALAIDAEKCSND